MAQGGIENGCRERKICCSSADGERQIENGSRSPTTDHSDNPHSAKGHSDYSHNVGGKWTFYRTSDLYFPPAHPLCQPDPNRLTDHEITPKHCNASRRVTSQIFTQTFDTAVTLVSLWYQCNWKQLNTTKFNPTFSNNTAEWEKIQLTQHTHVTHPTQHNLFHWFY